MNAYRLRLDLLESATGRFFLWTLAFVYGLVVGARNLLYLLPFSARKLKVRTICIGNLTTGGTGKTTAVLLAAQTLRKRDVKVAILSRGYRRSKRGNQVQVLLNSQNFTWQETGDEPWMMHRALKGQDVPILISPDRYKAGETALTYYNPQVLLLDDGFSHRRLARDLDIVLINALDPFGGGRLLPYGNLREPLDSLKRAGMLVITHSDQVSEERVAEIRGELAAVVGDRPILESAHRADFVYDLKEDRTRRLAYLKDRPIACLSAIGDPASFEELLRRSGANLVQAWRYPDHHPFTPEELRSIENIRNGVTLVTTFKDYPRLPAGWQQLLTGEVLALSIRLEITKGKSIWEETLCDDAAANIG